MFEIFTNKNARDLFDLNLISDFFSTKTTTSFKVDIKEHETNYEFIVEVPGIKKEDIEVKLTNDILSITVNNKTEMVESTSNYIRRERHSGIMTRSFKVLDANSEKISAKYQNGILQITVPKLTRPIDTHKTISIE